MAPEAILADSIDRLTGTFRRLEGLLEELRQDFGWLVPSGPPATGRDHLTLHRMALDPCGSDWEEKLLVTRDRIDFDLTASPLESDALDRTIDVLREVFDRLSRGQLAEVLSIVEDLREDLYVLVDEHTFSIAEGAKSPTACCSESPSIANSSEPCTDSPQPGYLF
jgi:hypothetical protein